MRHLPMLFLFVFLVACGDDTNPSAAPGDELTGTWVFVSETKPGATESIEQSPPQMLHLHADRTVRQTVVVKQGLELSREGTWSVVGGKLISIFAVNRVARPRNGETSTYSEAYTVRGDRLTLVDDEDQSIEVWERR